MNRLTKYGFLLLLLLSFADGVAQQDPQFTQYMFNTITVNPAYAGSRGHLSALGLHRSQWVGVNGAPTTQVVAVEGPVDNKVGLGFVITNDQLGPSSEVLADANFSYTLRLDEVGRKLSFGFKAGLRVFNLDFSRGQFEDPDRIFLNNTGSQLFPTLGAGVYYHTGKTYFGIAIPNFFGRERYDGIEQSINTERQHLFLIGGKIWDVAPEIKFKPGFFVKWVPGAPIVADISANILLKETFNFGVAYRWADSFSGILGLQISPRFQLGYAYDLTATDLSEFNSGTHEVFLRFEFKTIEQGIKSPRFY